MEARIPRKLAFVYDRAGSRPTRESTRSRRLKPAAEASGTFVHVLSAWFIVLLVGPGTAVGGPNLMAIGNYGEVPLRQAVGRDSFPGNEVVYEFEKPAFDFGRVVVRSRQPNSIVRRDLFVGFSGDGLIVDTRTREGSGGSVSVDEVEIWLRIQGQIRPGRKYEWALEARAGNENLLESGFPAVIPAVWMDGEAIGAEAIVRQPPPQDDPDAPIQRLLVPHGVVDVKSFDRQTGGAWVVLRPGRFGAFFELLRFSFREAETPASVSAKADMPIPVRYIPIRDVLEDEIAQALQRGADALRRARNEQQFWPASNPEESAALTALAIAALGEVARDRETLLPSMSWLARQSSEGWAIPTVAQRLYSLSRFGGVEKFRQVIHADIQVLADDQFEDGGWAAGTRGDRPAEDAVIRPDNPTSALVLRALREARFAGATIDRRIWRDALRYWTDAKAYDGGFRETLERFGGLGTATTSAYTGLGAAALITSLDMAAGFDGRRCNTYLASRRQLRAIEEALAWLDTHYRERLSNLTTFSTGLDPYGEPYALQWLGEVSGRTRFNDKAHFAESARALLEQFDKETGMFGLRGGDDSRSAWAEAPSLARTARALWVLGSGGAPTVCQRIIVGEDEEGWSQYNSDAAHLVRYLAAQRGRPYNWRRARIDQSVRELVEVPILLLSVVGPFDWSTEQWHKIREYCLAGGTVVIDLTEGQEAQRTVIDSALRATFPEYTLADLPAESPIFSLESELASPPAVRALSNGFRSFLFVPAESWSCQWHLYDVKDHQDSFAFMDNLLTYATDGTPLPSSFLPSTYAVGSEPAYSMSAAHLETGGHVPAYPNLVATMDRLLQANYRLAVREASNVEDADLVWLSVTGPAPPDGKAKVHGPKSEVGESIERGRLSFDRSSVEDSSAASPFSEFVRAIRGGKFVLADVVSGQAAWDEGFRSALEQTDGVTIEPLRRVHPVFTGRIPGTVGFDVVESRLRRALAERFGDEGRAELYLIRWNDKAVGVYSAYDIASGIGYHYYPGCRGVMPKAAREIAMNAFLFAYAQKERSGQNEGHEAMR